MKFVIDIEDEAFEKGNGKLYKASAFNSLVFDAQGLKNLTPYDATKAYFKGYKDGENNARYNTELIDEMKQAEYKRGAEDSWDAAKKIVCDEEDGGYKISVLEDIFDDWAMGEIAKKMTAMEAIEKVRAYEERKKDKEEIKVGDEIRRKKIGDKYIVISVTDGDNSVMYENGMVYKVNLDNFERTWPPFPANHGDVGTDEE